MCVRVCDCMYVPLRVSASICDCADRFLSEGNSFLNTNNICFIQQVHLLFYTHTHTYMDIHIHTGTTHMYSMICICRGAVVIRATQDSSSSCPTSFVLCLCRVCLGRFSLSPSLPLSFPSLLPVSFLLLCQDKNSFFIWCSLLVLVVVGRKPRRIIQRRQTTF